MYTFDTKNTPWLFLEGLDSTCLSGDYLGNFQLTCVLGVGHFHFLLPPFYLYNVGGMHPCRSSFQCGWQLCCSSTKRRFAQPLCLVVFALLMYNDICYTWQAWKKMRVRTIWRQMKLIQMWINFCLCIRYLSWMMGITVCPFCAKYLHCHANLLRRIQDKQTPVTQIPLTLKR